MMSGGSHRLWTITEVVREVMKQCRDEEASLASCACISRAISEPALEVLWEELDGLYGLFSLLSNSFRWEADGLSDRKHHVMFAPIDDLQWARLQRYARLVKHYISNLDRLDGLAVSVLLQRTQGEPLFPRLRRLTWKTPIEVSSSFCLFLAPSLSEVTLDIYDLEQVLQLAPASPANRFEASTGMAMHAIQSRAFNVTSLVLRSDATQSTMNFVTSFDKLTNLNINTLRHPKALIQACQQLTQLEHLQADMALPRAADDAPVIPTLPVVMLNKLKSVSLMGPPQFLPAVLDAIRSPVLNTVKLEAEFDDDVWARCANILALRFAHSLRNVNMEILDSLNREDRNFADIFSPLYSLRQLQYVAVDVQFSTVVVLTDKDIEDAAQAWPHARRIFLPTSLDEDARFDENFTYTPTYSITSLEHFARHCPELYFLVLPLPDAAALQSLVLPAPSTYTNALNRINLINGEWSDDTRQMCKQYLTRIFPRLHEDSILLSVDLGLDDDDDW